MRKSVDCVASCICHCLAGVRSQNNLFPASLLFAGTFSASLNGFSSGFLVSSCIKACRLPKLRTFLPQARITFRGRLYKYDLPEVNDHWL